MKIDHPITVEDFRDAAAVLEGGQELRLREDGKGFATTLGERFCVAFCDLFRWGNSIPLKKEEVIKTYLGAVRREYGEEIDSCELQSSHEYRRIELDAWSLLESALDRTNVLSLVARLQGHLDSIGVSVIRRNEITISHATRSLYSPQMNFYAVLPELVNPVVASLLERAGLLVLAPDVIKVLASKSIGNQPPKITTLFIPVISDAIENALMAAAMPQTDVPARVLEEDEVTLVGQAAVERALVKEINALTYSTLKSKEPTAAILDGLAGEATPENQADRADVLSRCEATIENALSQYTYLIPEQTVAAVRLAVLNSVANETALELPELSEKGLFDPEQSDVVSFEESTSSDDE